MVYLGRVVGIGRTETGRPFVVYGVSGRSDASRQRKAVSYRTRVAIEPLGEMTPEQKQQSALLTYNAIRVLNDQKEEDFPFTVVSNGRHTNSIFEKIKKEGPVKQEIEGPLHRFGPEPDRYTTPRIVGVNDVDAGYTFLGIITQPRKPEVVQLTAEEITLGAALTISTYSGNSIEPEAPQFDKVTDVVRKVSLKGETPQKLADSFFEWMDSEFVVATASAVWLSEQYRWQLAVRNLYP